MRTSGVSNGTMWLLFCTPGVSCSVAPPVRGNERMSSVVPGK